MQCQHLLGVGGSGGEMTIPQKRMEQEFSALTQLDVSYGVPAQCGQEVPARAGVDSTQIFPSGLPLCRGRDGCRRRVPVPPITGGFRFQVSIHPPSHQHWRKLKEELPQTGWMCSAVASQPAAESPQPGRPQPPEIPTSSFPAKPGYDFTATPMAQPQHRLQPCPAPTCSPCPQPPAARDSAVGSWHVGADRGHSFCSWWLFYPSERGYGGSRLFPLGTIAGEQHEDVAGQRDPGDGLLALPITR